MFRRLIMAIFRLLMKYLLSSYTKHTWAVYMGKGGGKVGTTDTRSRAHFTPSLPHTNSPCKFRITA